MIRNSGIRLAILILVVVLVFRLCVINNVVSTKVPSGLSPDTSVRLPQHPQPVQPGPPAARYMLYDAHDGHLGNQRSALVNALFLAEALNVTLVLPHSRAGPPSSETTYPAPRTVSSFVLGNREVKEAVVPHSLLGRYFDYHRETPSVIFLDEFAQTDSYRALSSGTLPMNETDYTRHLNITLKAPGANSATQRRLCESSKGRCTPELECRDSLHYKQGSFGTDTLLLGDMYGPGNCTADSPRWLEIARALRPRKVYEDAVGALFSKIDGPIFGVQVRLRFEDEEDSVSRGPAAQNFKDMVMQEYAKEMKASKAVFVAYTPVGPTEVVAKRLIEACKGLNKKVYTVVDIKNASQAQFDDPYASAILDLTALSRTDTFAGRIKSTSSLSAVYLREILWPGQVSRFYSGAIFKHKTPNPRRLFTCLWQTSGTNSDPACQDQ